MTKLAYGSTDQRVNSPYARRHGRSRQIQQNVGDDRRSIPYDKHGILEAPEYVEGQRYSKRQLGLMAEKMLNEQHLTTKDAREDPVILLFHTYKERRRREIYVGSGTPDPSIVSGMYWRTHPKGRSFRTKDEMDAHGASFYR